MSKLDKLTESFRHKWVQFLFGCDAVEETTDWNKERNGEMDVWYELELTGIVLRLIASDGVFAQEEADYLNRCFGFEYTPQSLEEVWNESSDLLGESLDRQVQGSIARLRTVNGRLADSYCELLLLLCDIIAESDGSTAPEELEALQSLRAAVAGQTE